MKLLNLIRKTLKAGGRCVLTQSEWRASKGRGDALLTTPGDSRVFVNVGNHANMAEVGGTWAALRSVIAEDEAQATDLLVLAGLTVYSPIEWNRNIHNQLFFTRPAGGLYVTF